MDEIKLNIDHTLNPFCCMVSGIDDQYTWKTGIKLPPGYLLWASGMCGFGYIKSKKAVPPRMIFFGINTKNQYDNICRIMNCSYEKFENLVFKSTMNKIKDFIKKGYPVIIGPLDMYYLPYLKFFMNTHIPIHYIMIIGFNEQNNQFLVYDGDKENEQAVDFDLLEQALNVNIPGIGTKNTFHIFHWPESIPSFNEIAFNSISLKVDFMLNPPINNFGIKGMKNFASEVMNWQNELNVDEIHKSLNLMVEYMNDRFEGKSYNGGRIRFADEYLKITSEVLNEKELNDFIIKYYESGDLLDGLARRILNSDFSLKEVSSTIFKVANIEEEIYIKIKTIIK